MTSQLHHNFQASQAVHRDLCIQIERVLCETFLWPVACMGMVKARKLRVSSKTVLDYWNRLADFCLVMQTLGQAGHSLSVMTTITVIFKSRSILWAFVVPKLILLFTTEGWSDRPYSINLISYSLPDCGRLALGLFTQDPEVWLHPEGLCQASGHDKPIEENDYKLF